MADKPATGTPQDEVLTDIKQEEVSSKNNDSKETSANVPDPKPVEAPPDIKAAKIEEVAPPAKPFEVSKEPCNRITAPPPMKSCSCTPKPSLREAFREALHKLCPKSRSSSKTAVVCLDQKKNTDRNTETQTPPQEICLKAKDYSQLDFCKNRSGDVAKTNKDSNNTDNGSAKPKDETDNSPKEKEIESNNVDVLPPCPYPCAPVDDYNKYDLTPGSPALEPVAKEPEPQETAAPEPEDSSAQGNAATPETSAPPPPAKEETKPVRDHCKKTPPQTEFCGYRKSKDETE